MKTIEETSVLKVMELLAIKDTLNLMKLQKQDDLHEIPKCICTKHMEEYEFDETALLRLATKLLQSEEVEDEGRT